MPNELNDPQLQKEYLVLFANVCHQINVRMQKIGVPTSIVIALLPYSGI